MPDNTKVTLSATGLVNELGKFEIVAITAGEAKGWKFSEEVLRASMDLWQGVECFVDHGGWWGGRSVRDLGGVCSDPQWSIEHDGIKLDLQTLGPSGELVTELGRQLLEENPPPKVGFSADLMMRTKGREVKTILRILDLSLVFNPAAGGAFVRAMNQLYPESIRTEVNEMPDEEVITTQSASTGGTAAQLAEDQAAIQELQMQTEHQEHLAAEAEEARKARIQMCAYLLDSGLNAAQLPDAMCEHVRKQFDGQVFTAQELNDSIDEARGLVTELQGSGTVRGPTVSGMYDSADQLQAAVDDMLQAPRDEGSEPLKPARLSGVKELYMMMTGDRNLYGGYYPEHVQLATTANFTGLVKNAMNKIVAATWAELGKAGYDWWMRCTTQEHFETLNDVTGILVGTVGSLPEVAEGGEYTELKVGDSPETKAFTKDGTQ